jgi:hypothetical protein
MNRNHRRIAIPVLFIATASNLASFLDKLVLVTPHLVTNAIRQKQPSFFTLSLIAIA